MWRPFCASLKAEVRSSVVQCAGAELGVRQGQPAPTQLLTYLRRYWGRPDGGVADTDELAETAGLLRCNWGIMGTRQIKPDFASVADTPVGMILTSGLYKCVSCTDCDGFGFVQVCSKSRFRASVLGQFLSKAYRFNYLPAHLL